MQNTYTSLAKEARIFIIKNILEEMSKEEIIEQFFNLHTYKDSILDCANKTLKPFHIEIEEMMDCTSEKCEYILEIIHTSAHTEKWNKKHTKFLADVFNEQGEWDFRKTD